MDLIIIQRSNSAPSTPVGISSGDKRSKSCCDNLSINDNRKIQVHFNPNENGLEHLSLLFPHSGYSVQQQQSQSVGMTNKDANYTDNYVRTPSIHISENPLSETSLNSLIIESSKISYATVKDQTSLKSGQDGGTNSPLGLANGLDIAGSNNQCHRINRLLSIGPEFHIQIKNPTSIEFMNWNSKTGAEKRLICIILLMLILFPVFLLITTHIINRKDSKRAHENLCLSSDCVKIAASLLEAMDTSTEPCEDFFHYACGNWNKKHVIPEDKSSISTFEVLGEEIQLILRNLLEEPASGLDNSATIKAKTFYKSCLNLDKIEEIGDLPLKKIVESLGGWPVTNKSWVKSDSKLEQLLAKVRAEYHLGVIFEVFVTIDDRNSSANILQIDQMVLGLPSKDYFLKPGSKKDRDAYLKLMVDIAILMGADEVSAKREMEKVLLFEIYLANAILPEADRLDTGSLYNKMTVEQLSQKIPKFDWLTYFNYLLPNKIHPNESIVVYCLNYLKQINSVFSYDQPKVLQNYIVWRVLQQLIAFVGGEYQAKRADFRKVTSGITAERLRWSYCVDMVNKRLGTAVGSLFIRDHFDPKSKETALKMIHGIREAFNELLMENDWMDEETKKVAQEKAYAINERIGYSDYLTNQVEVSKEYAELQVYEDQFMLNVLNLLKFETLKNFERLRQPVDKNIWSTEPAVVNAFYNPNKNDIVFPAGILQPHFYGHNFPKSLNYGGIGVVIGHEITHGFDAKGRQFDKDGNMREWWNNVTIEKFKERAQCIIDQYSSYVVKDIGININGKLTQGENIADNGGLKQAYRAFKKWEKDNQVEPLLPGLNLNHDQLFFLNYAQIWCGTMRPQDALHKVRTATHSPGHIRVLGPLSNSLDFSRVFSCPIGSRMNPKKKCSVW